MKLKNSIATVLLIVVALIGNAQEKELFVEYKFSTPEDMFYTGIELYANSDKCLSKVVRTYSGTNFRTGVTDQSVSYRHVYKDYQSNLMISDELLSNNTELVAKEEMGNYKWELTSNTKEILGYKCREAKTKHRGRDYIAFFTTDIPFKAAPWKFHGLPGVVLSIETTDEFVKAEAMSLKIQEPAGIENPFTEVKEILEWEKFCEHYKKVRKSTDAQQAAHFAKRGITDPSATRSHHARVEIIVEADRTSIFCGSSSSSGGTVIIRSGNLE